MYVLENSIYTLYFLSIDRPLTLSEHLAKITQKIDFNKINGDEISKEQSESGEKGEEDSKDPASFQSSLWPWDSVRNKLRFV